MNITDAQALIDSGGRIRMADSPPGVVYDNTHPIPAELAGRLDFVETQDSPATETTLPNPATTTTQGTTMTAIAIKSSSDTEIKGSVEGQEAAIVLVKKATSTNPEAALPVIGEDGKSISVIGLQKAEGVALAVKAVLKTPEGEGVEVSANSNLFDIVESVTMIPAMNEDGTPKLDPLTQEPVMVSGAPALTVKVIG